MAESQVAQLQPTQKLKLNQGYIQAKIVAKRIINTQEGKLFLTLVKMPAPNEFSHPATAELRSSESLGEKEETITVKVQLGGLPNNYETKSIDDDTGEVTKKPVRSARNEYTVIAD